MLHIPPIGAASAQSIESGRDTYFSIGCHHCHGDDGTGTTAIKLFDDEGRPIVPRDLVHDSMKGGSEAESIFKRLRLGMPGTPHPALASLDDAELSALVHYCLSLSQEPKRRLTNHQRATTAANPMARSK
jgi:mono/diheme cytochrome c family protein